MLRTASTKRLTGLIVAGLLATAAARVAAAQDNPIDVRRAQASRAELEKALKEIDLVIESPAYSKSFRKTRAAEADLVRQRLSEGDFQSGDEIDIAVVGETTLTGKFKVLSGRTLSLPGLPAISLQGVLRSEVKDYLTTEIGKYVRNPQVSVQGSYIRMSVMGSVGNPGYYTLAADALISDAIMQAGGPATNVKMEKSVVRRQGREIMSGTELQRAIEAGQSLDQLNLHGGDEINLGGTSGSILNNRNQGGNWRSWFWPVQAALSVSYLLIRIF